MQRMDALYKRALVNKVEVRPASMPPSSSAARPDISGLGGLFETATGIVDYKGVWEAMGKVIRAAGGEIEKGVTVDPIPRPTRQG